MLILFDINVYVNVYFYVDDKIKINDNVNVYRNVDEDNKNSIKTEKKERVVNEVLEWIFCIVIAVVLAFLIKGFVGTFTTVKQESMYPTLKNDQRLWLDRTVRTFNRRI